MVIRFSTVIGRRDSSEVARDPRGFAVKFYTEDGNWDFVGNNLPVFFIRDAIKFPDVIHSLKPDPVTFRQEANAQRHRPPQRLRAGPRLLRDHERDVQERMLWHFFLVHDDYSHTVAKSIGMTAKDVRGLRPLAKQVLTDEDQRRLENLGANGDGIDKGRYGKHTGSVETHPAKAEDLLSMASQPNPRYNGVKPAWFLTAKFTTPPPSAVEAFAF